MKHFGEDFGKLLERVHMLRGMLLVSLVGAGLLCAAPLGRLLHGLLAVFVVVTILLLTASQSSRR
jgi:hypothetical protein